MKSDFRQLCLRQVSPLEKILLNCFLLLGIVGGLTACSTSDAASTEKYSNPIVFVTQIPIGPDFATIASTFANQRTEMESVGRGGDLWIKYPNGKLKNLTKAAGLGEEGQQGAKAIAVRDPSAYWDGKKIIFSMVVGAPEAQYKEDLSHWQLYEMMNLEETQTPIVTKIANQPDYNNIAPIYGTDDRIIFTSDRPRDGSAHLYPQLDEYESTQTVTGLWSLDPSSANLKLLNHAPSGNFTPILDSYGRIVFTQWDHLKRDQQADADKFKGAGLGTFNFASEAANAEQLQSRTEVFPEPLAPQEVVGTNLNNHDFNQFMPWTILEDGTESETLNHVGRHEMYSREGSVYLPTNFNDNPNLQDFYPSVSGVAKDLTFRGLFQLKEDPSHRGVYYAINTGEFDTHSSGQIVRINAAPETTAGKVEVVGITDPSTSLPTEQNKTPNSKHSGMYRNPLPLKNGQLIAAHSPYTFAEREGQAAKSPYTFRIKEMKQNSDGVWIAGAPLTDGIKKAISYWSPDKKITFDGNLWELQPIELVARSKPQRLTHVLPASVQQVLQQANINLSELRTYLKEKNLALAVVQNVTTRDSNDLQQPFNLQVPGGLKTLSKNFREGDKIYDVSHLQFMQADQIRGMKDRNGRRVLAQPMHDSNAIAANASTQLVGATVIASDGSAAAFVPATRALSWQLTDAAGTPVVRERYWLSFQPGEIRVCGSCHGVNETDQAGKPAPANPPKAFLDLLNRWKTIK